MADTLEQGRALRQVGRGIMLKRAAAVTPQSAATSYFQIFGGMVELTNIVGLVAVVFTATATNLKLTATPSGGADPADICAVVAGANTKLGTLMGITGVPGDAMLLGGSVPAMLKNVVLNTGTLDFSSSGNNTTSQTSWVITYRPIDDGAYMTVL